MNQLKIYKYTALLLLVLNVGMLAFFFMTGSNRNRPEGNLKDNAKAILHLDNEQNDRFLTLAKAHSEAMNTLDIKHKAVLSSYLEQLLESDMNFDSKASALEIGAIEKEKVESTFHHFKDVKSLLREEQQPYFEKFIMRAMQFMLSKNKKRPPSNRG